MDNQVARPVKRAQPMVAKSKGCCTGDRWSVDYEFHESVNRITDVTVGKNKTEHTVIEFKGKGDGEPYGHDTSNIPNEEAAQMKISGGSVTGNGYRIYISGRDPTPYYS